MNLQGYVKSMGGTLKVTLFWFPSHRDIEGYERADRLAKPGSALRSLSARVEFI